MIEFIDEQALQFLSLLALGYIAPDLRRADDPAGFVVQGRHGDRHVDPTPVLCDAYGLEMLDKVA